MAGAINTPAYRRFLELLIAFRKERGISQLQMAERLGRHSTWVSKSELGERRLDPIEVTILADAMDVEADELFALVKRAVAETQNSSKL